MADYTATLDHAQYHVGDRPRVTFGGNIGNLSDFAPANAAAFDVGDAVTVTWSGGGTYPVTVDAVVIGTYASGGYSSTSLTAGSHAITVNGVTHTITVNAIAGTVTWVGGGASEDFSDGANYDPPGVPDGDTDVIIPGTGAPVGNAGGPLTCRNCTINGDGSNNSALDSGTTINATGTITNNANTSSSYTFTAAAIVNSNTGNLGGGNFSAVNITNNGGIGSGTFNVTGTFTNNADPSAVSNCTINLNGGAIAGDVDPSCTVNP